MPVSLLESPIRHLPAAVYQSDNDISDGEDRELRDLLFTCFSYNPVFLARRFFRERPWHRWLIRSQSGEMVAHAALHEKTIGTPSGDVFIGGVAEVCVAPDHRGKGFLKELMRAMDHWLQDQPMAFAMLFGDPRIYASSGYTPIRNALRADNALSRHWNPFCGKPMIKCLAQDPWPTGLIDLRGPTF